MTDSSNSIAELLRQLSDTLIINASFLDNVGLVNGKTGVALFFFHLAQATGIDVYEEYAGDLIDQVCESLHQDMPARYADGLAGIGAGIAYMIRQRFVDADADDALEEIDSAVRHHILYHLPATPEMGAGIAGLGKYCTERLASRADVTAEVGACLLRVVEALSCPYSTYRELLSAIHFLSGALPLGVAPEKTAACLSRAVDKLEAMVREDVHLGKFPGAGFNPLAAAATLLHAADKTGVGVYAEKAQQYLQRYEQPFRPHLSKAKQAASLKWSCLYQHLGQKLGRDDFFRQAEEWLSYALTAEFEPHACMGLVDGYAGAGMYLLLLSGRCSGEWLDIVPCYMENSQ
jgi:hypothetical protein